MDKIAKIVENIKSIINSGSLPPPVDLAHSTPSSLRQFINRDEEVPPAIHNIPLNTLPLDFILTTIFKSCSDIFMLLIITLVNLSSERRFPDVFNFGQVIPLLKKPGMTTRIWLISGL